MIRQLSTIPYGMRRFATFFLPIFVLAIAPLSAEEARTERRGLWGNWERDLEMPADRFSGNKRAAAEIYEGVVTRVVDGDTFAMQLSDGREIKVQLYGIDAPEREEIGGDKARTLLQALVLRKKVRVESDYTDQYDRLVSRVYVGDMYVNRHLVRQGAARYVQRYAPGDTELPAAETEARTERRGLWGNWERDLEMPADRFSGNKRAAAEIYEGEVTRVVDGDTFAMRLSDGREIKVQLYGIDAPEREEIGGDKARTLLQALVLRKKVRVESDYTDQYNRVVSRVYVGNMYVNRHLVRQGAARYVQRYAPGDTELPAAEADARTERKGLWGNWEQDLEMPVIPVDRATDGVPAKVKRVQDGDSCILFMKGKETRVRLYGIDAPELSQEYGKEAMRALSKLIGGKTVRVVQKDIDPYDRVVALLFVGKKNVSLEMIRSGSAWYNDKFAPLDTYLEEAQEQARAAKRGLWKNPHAVSPWVYKRHNPRL